MVMESKWRTLINLLYNVFCLLKVNRNNYITKSSEYCPFNLRTRFYKFIFTLRKKDQSKTTNMMHKTFFLIQCEIMHTYAFLIYSDIAWDTRSVIFIKTSNLFIHQTDVKRIVELRHICFQYFEHIFPCLNICFYNNNALLCDVF